MAYNQTYKHVVLRTRCQTSFGIPMVFNAKLCFAKTMFGGALQNLVLQKPLECKALLCNIQVQSSLTEPSCYKIWLYATYGCARKHVVLVHS